MLLAAIKPMKSLSLKYLPGGGNASTHARVLFTSLARVLLSDSCSNLNAAIFCSLPMTLELARDMPSIIFPRDSILNHLWIAIDSTWIVNAQNADCINESKCRFS